MKQPFIKICGITQPSIADACVALGADALGLVFYKPSPRNVSKKAALEISRAIPDQVMAVGVFVDESDDFIMERVETGRLDAVQLSGNEPVEQARRLSGHGVKVIKTVFHQRAPGFDRAADYTNAWAYIVECGTGKLPGGTGIQWDWQLAAKMDPSRKTILAGGLDPGNVSAALAASGAFGVDVSSGVESAPGIKDMVKVRQFITAARQAVK